MGLIIVSAAVPEYTPKHGVRASSNQFGFFYLSLMIIALGSGFIKPVVSVFGAD